MQYVDRPFASDVHIVSPEMAYMAGKLKTDNVQALRTFERTFPLNPQVVMSTVLALRDEYAQREEVTAKDKMDVLFNDIVPKCYLADQDEPGSATVYHFKIGGAGDYTVSVTDGVATGADGLVGEATCTVSSEYDDFRQVLRYELLEDSGQVSSDQLEAWSDEEDLDAELDDEQLEAIAGGKGGCGAEASAGSACGADYCGAAAGAGNACGAAACAADAGAGNACGAAACGAAVGVGTACGADACAAAAGAGTVCGAAAGVGACAGDVCGAAVGAGVCAGNVCGVDILAGADVGPCAVNVIPLVPGC